MINIIILLALIVEAICYGYYWNMWGRKLYFCYNWKM